MRGDAFDLVVVGAGPAGEKGAAQAAYFGKRVAIVDRSERPGGSGALDAWVPSKTLREAALYLTGFRHRDAYEGLSLGLDPTFAVARLRARATRVVEAITNQVRTNIDNHGITLVQGEAQLGPDHTVLVTKPDGSTHTLHGEIILLATGSRPYHPPAVDFDDPDVLDSATVLDVDEPVRRMVIIGGGAVGCEYASIFRALGTDVTLIDTRAALVPLMDADVSDGLATALRGIGVQVLLESGRVHVARDADGLCAVVPGHGEIRTDKVLFAAGRTGNVEGLGLDALGVKTNERGHISVDANYQTTAPGIYAAGDVIGPPALASVSMEQARVAVCHAFGIPFKQMVSPITPVGVYSIPEAAGVGITPQQADAEGIDCEIGMAPYSCNSRAIISGGTDGFVKLVFRRDDRRLLGVHILGDAATELIHHGQAALHFGGTIDHFIETVYNVPTLSETYKYAAYDGLQRLARAAGAGT